MVILAGSWILQISEGSVYVALQLHHYVKVLPTGWFKKCWHFWMPFFFKFLTSSVKILLTSVNNVISSIFHKHGNENDHLVLKLKLFKTVNEFYPCPRVCQWPLGSTLIFSEHLGKNKATNLKWMKVMVTLLCN